MQTQTSPHARYHPAGSSVTSVCMRRLQFSRATDWSKLELAAVRSGQLASHVKGRRRRRRTCTSTRRARSWRSAGGGGAPPRRRRRRAPARPCTARTRRTCGRSTAAWSPAC
uniref:Uncharacterized protein n=1 Tax=Zea mays TaxID=4577 RepID=C0HIS5_MAIZE|nr:unknown [Zea mays]